MWMHLGFFDSVSNQVTVVISFLFVPWAFVPSAKITPPPRSPLGGSATNYKHPDKSRLSANNFKNIVWIKHFSCNKQSKQITVWQLNPIRYSVGVNIARFHD